MQLRSSCFGLASHMGDVLRMATRKSKLALAQSTVAAEKIMAQNPGLKVERIEVVSEGDRHAQDIKASGGKDVFVNSLREAVKKGKADCACHSLKDVGLDTKGFVLAAMLTRADPRDALVGKDLALLARMEKPVVATGSPRRTGQLSCMLQNADVVSIRGNVDTRIAKLENGALDALVLACAGLDRLGLEQHISQRLDAGTFVPAPCQGTVVVECLADDDGTKALVEKADDKKSRMMSVAERACAKKIGADCDTPLGAHATISDGGKITVKCSLSHRGRHVVGKASGKDAAVVGTEAAADMLALVGKDVDWRLVFS